MNYSTIIDLALLALLLATVLAYRKKGFLAGICSLAGSLVAAVGAYIVAGRVSLELFNSFLKTGMVDRVTGMLSSAAGAVQTSEIVADLLGFLPANLVESIMAQVDNLAPATEATGVGMAAQVVEQVVAPVVVPLISIVVFFLVFIAARMLISMVAAALTGVNRVPLLGGVNRLLGCGVGLLAGAVNAYVAVCALSAVALVTGGGLAALNQQVLEGSRICAFFSAYNPFIM